MTSAILVKWAKDHRKRSLGFADVSLRISKENVIDIGTIIENEDREIPIKRIDELQNGIKEFLSHSMEFTCDANTNYEIECPSCGAHQSAVKSNPLEHKDTCHLMKLQELIK